MTLSIQETYADKNLLVTGASGFLGKVWLAMALQRIPNIGRVYVLLRKKGLRPARDRFEKIVRTSPVFKPLHEAHGAGLGAFLAERVEVVDGDIGKPDFGMAPEVAERLRGDLDLIVNCAGLVDFNPDIRLSISTNIEGALHAIEYVASCDRARLVHVSTCYVAGITNGQIPETIDLTYSPKGAKLDPHAELAELRAAVDRIVAEQETPEAEAALAADVVKVIRDRGLDETNPTLVRNMTHRQRQQRLKKAMVAEGERRANDWGWTNTYTYSKSIAESLLAQRAAELGAEYTVVRPAIVESAQTFPFPGWNEGFNTSGPIVYLLGTWWRQLPCKTGTPFDVIPVDMVCNGLTIAGAALLRGEHAQVYQAGTSERNCFTVERAAELTSLGHRKHLRKHGDTALDRMVLSRWDAVVSKPDAALSAGNMSKTARKVSKLLRKLPSRLPKTVHSRAEGVAEAANTAAKQLRGIDHMLGLFKPFIYDNHYVFESRAMHRHTVLEPEFRFEPESIDWRRYWINVQLPGLRKWCFPQFEGKRIETYKPKHPFTLQEPVTRRAPAAQKRAASETR